MKFLCTLSIIVLLLPCTYAQFDIAPTVGANISSFHQPAESLQEYTSRNGFYVGAHSRYLFSNRFGISLEGQFSQKGAKGAFRIDEPSISREYYFKARINYLDILPGIEYRLWDFLSLNAGFNAGIELSEYYETLQDSGEPFISFFDSPNLGSWFGAKVHLNKLFVKFHYNHGFTNLGEITHTDANGNVTGTSNQYDRTYQVGLGYYLF